jgi:hypothetical protein
MEDKAVRRVAVEFAATLAALGAVSLYMQLQEPTSRVRLRLSELGDALHEWRVQAKVSSFIDSIRED